MKWYLRILSIVMVNVFLITTTGYTASAHYCKGELYSFALFGEAEECPMADHVVAPEKKCCHAQKTEPKKCCHDQKIVVKGMDVDGETLDVTDIIPTSFELSFTLLPVPQHSIWNSPGLAVYFSSKSPPGNDVVKLSLLSMIQVYRL